MYITIDRFEGDVAVCFDEKGVIYNIHLGELPEEAREGDVLEYTAQGYIVSYGKTEDHTSRIADKMQRRFYDEN